MDFLGSNDEQGLIGMFKGLLVKARGFSDRTAAIESRLS